MNSTRRLCLSAAVALGLAGLLVGCEQAKPQITFQSMAIQRLALDTVEYMATFDAINPNSFDLMIDEVHWTLATGEAELVSGAIIKNSDLPSKKPIQVHVYVQIQHRLLERAGLKGARQFPFTLTGLAKVSGPLGPMTIPFAAAGRMPILRPMQVELVGVDNLGMTETRVGLCLNAAVTNPNDISLTPSELKGQFLINEQPLIQIDADLAKAEPVPAHQTVRMKIPVWVNSPEVGVRTLSKMITASNPRYRLIGAMEFRVPGITDVTEMLAAGAATQPATEPAADPVARPAE